MRTLLLAAAAVMVGVSVPTPAPPTTRPTGEVLPIGLCLVPEMEYIPELDCWTAKDVEAAPEHVKATREQWAQKASELQGHVTPDLARVLSRWARKQMAEYRRVPPLKGAALRAVRKHAEHHKLLFEATLDTLPTHSSIVTRWLKAYVLYDEGTRKILRVTITIRGEILE